MLDRMMFRVFACVWTTVGIYSSVATRLVLSLPFINIYVMIFYHFLHGISEYISRMILIAKSPSTKK